MMKWSLRLKILLSVGFLIFIILGTSTYVHIQDLKQDYLEAITWRSEALAQLIKKDIMEMYGLVGKNIENMRLEGLALLCEKLYNMNRDKGVSHFAIMDSSWMIAAHNDSTLWETPVEDPAWLEQLNRLEQSTVIIDTAYHTLMPIFGEAGEHLATVDIGIPKSVVDNKVREMFFHSVVLFVLFLILTFFAMFFLTHVLITKPIKRLITMGQQLAQGNLIQSFQAVRGGDEMAVLGTVFNRMAHYLTNIAEVASHIATGVLKDEVQIRSDQDTLGKSVQEMLRYLKQVATVATKVADGDLTETVQVRSADDAFGQVIHAMTEGLRALIVQIRTSAEQLDSIRKTISSLTDSDKKIVEHMHASTEKMMMMMRDMGISIGEVANNMNTLSSSVQETSDSVLLMTSSITLVSSNATELTQRAHQTIESLETAVKKLETVVESTNLSKQLSQGAIKDALAGQQAVEQVIAGMEAIHQTITTAVDTITRFAQRSQDIDKILDVIREITDQTSLLALNASIISAQAGTHGRGFAVIADEIKNLADGVGNSTKDIATIVHTLQQDTNSVVQTIHAGAVDVKQGVEQTEHAREALQKIITSAQQSSSVVTEIADTLQNLMATSRDVVAAMEEVNAMAEDFTAATNEQEQGTEHINEAIVHINDMITQIQQSTTEQSGEVQRFFDVTTEVTTLINRTLESSQKIAGAAVDLSSQADTLLHSVDRFKLESQSIQQEDDSPK